MVVLTTEQENTSAGDIYDRIVAEAQRNHDEWYSNRVPNLNYHDPVCRLAYLYIVAAANAATFKHVIEVNDELRNHILQIVSEHDEIRLCAFGAGPGTELLAMAKFFDEQHQGLNVRVDFQLLDKVKGWADSWYGIRDEVINSFRLLYGKHSNWPMIPSGNFLPCDVTQLEDSTALGHVWNHDIYVVNFLLSEIFNNDPGLRSFLSKIVALAPKGAHFVFIERRGWMWQQRMEAIASEAGLVLSRFFESKCESLGDETPSDLGSIYTAISERQHPRTKWNVVYSIGKKPLR